MKSMPNKNPLSVKGDNGRDAAQDRKVKVILHPHLNSEVVLYKMNADLSGNMGSVAPESATAKQQLESVEMEK